MSAAKRRGTAAESKVVAYLQDHGWPYAERRALRGTDDRGDVAGMPGVCVEVKDVASEGAMASWVDEMLAETVNAKARVGFVIRRRRGKPNVGDWFVLMTVDQVLALLAEDAA